MPNQTRMLVGGRKSLTIWWPISASEMWIFIQPTQEPPVSVIRPNSHVKITCFYGWGPAATFFSEFGRRKNSTRRMRQHCVFWRWKTHWMNQCLSVLPHAGSLSGVSAPGLGGDKTPRERWQRESALICQMMKTGEIKRRLPLRLDILMHFNNLINIKVMKETQRERLRS